MLQGGGALNNFGSGLILPFEIIYLHAARGFSTATAGLVLATVMGTAAVVTLPSGALLDRLSAKRLLIAGNVLNALGYGGLAFVHRPWQGFVCSTVAGAGFGLVGTAGQVLTLTWSRRSSAPRRPRSGESQATSASALARRLRASSSRPPIITSGRSRSSTSSTQSRSSSSRWLWSSGSRIPASRMLRRRTRVRGASERLLGIGFCSP